MKISSRRAATSALAGALLAGLVAAALPPAAQAAGTAYQPYGSAALLTVGSHQYYDVYGSAARDISQPSLFLRKVLTTPVPGAGINSLADLWSDLGRTIYFSSKTNQDRGFFAGNSNGTMSWVNGPVTEASSVASVDQQIRGQMGMPDGYVTNSDLADNTSTQSVFFQLRSAAGDLGGTGGLRPSTTTSSSATSTREPRWPRRRRGRTTRSRPVHRTSRTPAACRTPRVCRCRPASRCRRPPPRT